MFALNQGEVCTCPSRALVQESIYDRFMEKALKRVGQITQGSPLDASTMIGAQASEEQLDKILSYIQIGKDEGAELLIGGARELMPNDLAGGYYVQPTVFRGQNKMRIFQEEIFGPVLAVTTFKDEEEALSDRQRHPLWPRRRRLDPRRQPLLPLRPRHPGRPGVGQLLPRLPGPRGVRRLQAVGRRARDPQDDARPLPADQEHAGQLQRQGARVLLKNSAPPPPRPAAPRLACGGGEGLVARPLRVRVSSEDRGCLRSRVHERRPGVSRPRRVGQTRPHGRRWLRGRLEAGRARSGGLLAGRRPAAGLDQAVHRGEGRLVSRRRLPHPLVRRRSAERVGQLPRPAPARTAPTTSRSSGRATIPRTAARSPTPRRMPRLAAWPTC